MGTMGGVEGPESFASISFYGSKGASISFELIGNFNIRDWNAGMTTDNITSPDVIAGAFVWPSEQRAGAFRRLDIQRWRLPVEFQNQEVTNMVLRDSGHGQVVFLIAATVAVKMSNTMENVKIPNLIPPRNPICLEYVDCFAGMPSTFMRGAMTEKIVRTNLKVFFFLKKKILFFILDY